MSHGGGGKVKSSTRTRSVTERNNTRNKMYAKVLVARMKSVVDTVISEPHERTHLYFRDEDQKRM
jgi:hypothetical protein